MLRFVLVAAVAAVLLAACSSSSSSSAPSSAPAARASTTTVAAAEVAADPSAGCTATTKIAPGEVKVDTTSDGAPRYYFRHVPPTYTGAAPQPLVIDLHGYSEGAAIHIHISGLGPFGDTHGFITLTPQGSGNPAVPLWDTTLGSPDVKFIGNLLDEAEKTLCIDQHRVFVAGLSNGAFMTSAVACAYSDRVAAVAPVAGIRDIKGCTFTRPVPVIAFHGTADPFVSYTGGLGPKALALPSPDGKSTLGKGVSKAATRGLTIPKITADWATRNGCGTKLTATPVTSDVTLLAFPCPAGAEVELYRVTGGGHSWPGSAVSVGLGPLVGKTTTTISANDLMWKFFQAHPLRT